MCLGSIGRVVRRWDEGGMPMASVAVSGIDRPVCLMYHPETPVGADVLVHMGFVVEILENDQAAEALRLRSGGAAPE